MNYGKKIQYNELKMKECQGNLKSLYQEWCEKRKVLEMNKKVPEGPRKKFGVM